MNIGLITYHHAYNFGSVLQAFATQRALADLGHTCKILDYRIPFQARYYGLLGYGQGLKGLVKKMAMASVLRERVRRRDRYECFIDSFLDVTRLYEDPEDIDDSNNDFDCFVSGSDQIWNIHSNEFIQSGFDYMKPYLLDFTDKPKLSYASSLANSCFDDIQKLLPYIRRFDSVSCRERASAELLSELLGSEVATVVDPTLLLPRSSWESITAARPASSEDGGYVLYYSLKGLRSLLPDLANVVKLGKRRKMAVLAITPLSPPVKMDGVRFISDAGPLEFLNMIRNAGCVFTDSYHGTVFSIIFNRPFSTIKYSEQAHNVRANDLLGRLSLTHRSCAFVSEATFDERIDYGLVNSVLTTQRTQSLRYLADSLTFAEAGLDQC